jgi:hypothetical protein
VSEMIERIARAMWERTHKEDGAMWPDDAERPEWWRDDARVAITAMSGPTDEMIEAGVRIHKTPRSGPDETLVHDIWQEMCDEALGVD